MQAQAEEYEITLARSRMLNLSLKANDFEAPDKATLVYFTASGQPPHEYKHWSQSNPTVDAHDAITRILVLAPGCLYADAKFDPKDENGNLNAVAHLERGPTVTVPRSELPLECALPLKASAVPKKIAVDLIGYTDAVIHFYSEGAVSDDGVVFGPFTPGTYDLKIVDADGKILWEQTKEFK
jgi:hypothetical protein